jgi:hypothetical protein
MSGSDGIRARQIGNGAAELEDLGESQSLRKRVHWNRDMAFGDKFLGHYVIHLFQSFRCEEDLSTLLTGLSRDISEEIPVPLPTMDMLNL